MMLECDVSTEYLERVIVLGAFLGDESSELFGERSWCKRYYIGSDWYSLRGSFEA